MSTFWTQHLTSLLACAAGALVVWLTFKRPSGVPPGPPFLLPLFGHALSVGKDPRKKFEEWRRKYGDIFSVYLGNRLVIVMNGYEVMTDAFVKHGDLFSDRPKTFVFDVISEGMGIVGNSGPVWKEQRRFTLSTLRDFGMGKRILEDAINQECVMFLQDIAERNGEKCDVRQLIHTAVSNIIATILFGKRFEYDDNFFQELTYKIDQNLQSAGATAALNFIPLGRYIPGDPFKFERTLRNLEFFEGRLTKPSIKEHLNDFDENNINDFVSAYIKEVKLKEKRNEETSIGYENLTKVIGDLVIAGAETTTTTIRWALLLLIKYPEIQEKCFQEIKENIGLDRSPQMSDRMNLPYTEATISEIQRLSNIIPVSIWHTVPHDITFRGYTFPKGVIIIPNMTSVLHDPNIFENPEKFRPERFLDANGKYLKRPEMIPFFLGKRVCIGESLAKMELFLFVTNLVQRFQFLLPSGEQPLTMEAVPGVTFAPKPYNLIAKPR